MTNLLVFLRGDYLLVWIVSCFLVTAPSPEIAAHAKAKLVVPVSNCSLDKKGRKHIS